MGSPIPDRQRSSRLFRSTSESSDELSELDLSHGKKDAFVLEVWLAGCPLTVGCVCTVGWVCYVGCVNCSVWA